MYFMISVNEILAELHQFGNSPVFPAILRYSLITTESINMTMGVINNHELDVSIQYSTGGSTSLLCLERLDRGAYGDVFKVLPTSSLACMLIPRSWTLKLIMYPISCLYL